MAKSKTRCKLCKITFASKAEFETHTANTPGHSHNRKCDCDGCNPSMLGLAKNDPRRKFSARRKSPYFRDCQPCGLSLLLCKHGIKVHRKKKNHRLQAKEMGLICPHSDEAFMSREEHKRHMDEKHTCSVTYRCIECSQDFPSICALEKHPRGDAVHKTKRPQRGILCKPCERTFSSAKAYDNHLKSKAHNGIRCFAYPTCRRTFSTKAGMIVHLESGACKSKLNRHKLDDLIRQHDTANVVLKVEYSNPANLLSSGLMTPLETPSFQPTSLPPFHSSSLFFPAATLEDLSDSDDDDGTEIDYPTRSASNHGAGSSPFSTASLPLFPSATLESPHSDYGGSTISDCPIRSTPFAAASLPLFTPTISEISDSDSDDEGTIILTPTSSFSRRESVSFPSPSSAIPSSSGVSTPCSTYSTTLSLQRVFGRKCYLCNREFKNEAAAQAHATSTAHAPRIYHCPSFLFPPGHPAKLPLRDFKSLSGLIAHLESGRCEGGKETLARAVEYVEERLRGVRVGGLLMDK